MLHILWILIKFILMFLAILLGLVVLVLLLILFCPIRYQASAAKEVGSFFDASASARISWLFGGISMQQILCLMPVPAKGIQIQI